MPTELRLAIRLIALWVIFITSLLLIFWSVQNFTVSVVKTVNGGYENYTSNIGGGYNSYCLSNPLYPTLSSSFGGGMPLNKDEQAQVDKYNKDLEKYNADFAALCKDDLARQKQSQENQEKSSSMGDMISYGLLSLLSIAGAAGSLKVIKKTETV